MLDIKITKTTAAKTKPDYDKLGFGNYYTDHMFLMNWEEGKGWARAGKGKGNYLHNLPQVVHIHFLCLYQFTQDVPGKRTGLVTSSFLD